MTLNQSCIGKRYPIHQTAVTRQAIEKYARACNDLNPAYFDSNRPGAIVAPPLFGATVIWPSVIAVVGDPELHVDMLRLVHSEHEVEFFAPIRPGDTIASQASIAAIESAAGGESMTMELMAHNQLGELVQKTLFTVFIRGPRASRATARADERPEGPAMAEITECIAEDQTRRYAEASGDYNPIHLDEAVARMAGLPGIILHGLCTAAICAKELVGNCCDNDPARLRRLRIRFVRPVLPGQTITTKIWFSQAAHMRQVYQFQTFNPAGQAVIRAGIAEVAPPRA